MGLFHRITEMEGWCGGHLVQPRIKSGPAKFSVILFKSLTQWDVGRDQFTVQNKFSFFLGKLLSWA